MKKALQICLIIAALIGSITGCKGRRNDLGITSIEIATDDGRKIVFGGDELCAVVDSATSIKVSFCRKLPVKAKLDGIGYRFKTITLYSDVGEYEAECLNVFQATFPKAEWVFMVDNAGKYVLSDWDVIVLTKRPPMMNQGQPRRLPGLTQTFFIGLQSCNCVIDKLGSVSDMINYISFGRKKGSGAFKC